MPNPVAAVATIQKKLTPGELKAALRICVSARRSVMVHGDPGLGKSEIAMQLADELYAEAYKDTHCVKDGECYEISVVREIKGKHAQDVTHYEKVRRPWFKDTRAALLDAVDLRGLPTVVDGKASWAVPDFLPTDPRGGIWLLDEINRGSEMTMNALFSGIIPPYQIGEWDKPEAWVAVACVNDQDVGARRMSSALLARFVHLDMGGDPNDAWLKDLTGIAVDRDWHPMVIAFLRSYTHLVHKYNAKERVSPNPRSWEFISSLMYQNPPTNVLKALAAGTIGEGAATEFVAFADLYTKLPNLDAVIASPTTADIPEKPSVLYAMSAALARRATDKNFDQIMVYLDRVAKEKNRPEFCVCCVLDATRRNKDLQYLPCWTKWAQKYHEVLL